MPFRGVKLDVGQGHAVEEGMREVDPAQGEVSGRLRGQVLPPHLDLLFENRGRLGGFRLETVQPVLYRKNQVFCQ